MYPSAIEQLEMRSRIRDNWNVPSWTIASLSDCRDTRVVDLEISSASWVASSADKTIAQVPWVLIHVSQGITARWTFRLLLNQKDRRNGGYRRGGRGLGRNY